MALHLALLWNRGLKQLENGLQSILQLQVETSLTPGWS